MDNPYGKVVAPPCVAWREFHSSVTKEPLVIKILLKGEGGGLGISM
jgi:hypothetical protein